MNSEKIFKSEATGAVGMCASRRDVHMSIAQGVSGNGRGGQRGTLSTSVGVRVVGVVNVRCTLSMPGGISAGMAGGAAA